MAVTTERLELACIMTSACAFRNDDNKGKLGQAFKIVQGGGGVVKSLCNFWPSFVYSIAPDQKNPLDPMPEELKGKFEFKPVKEAGAMGRDISEGGTGDSLEEFLESEMAKAR